MSDLIIKNGIVIDPSQNIHKKMDIYIKDGIFVSCDDFNNSNTAVREIDAEGCYVTAGLIDSHGHVFEGGSELGGRADLLYPPNCVTTVIDAGSAGYFDFDIFQKEVISKSTTTIKATISPTNHGVQMPPHEEIQDPEYINIEKLRKLFRKYSNDLVGIKLRVHEGVTREFGLEALKRASDVSKKLQEEGFQCNLMVHFGNLQEGIKVEDVLNHLNKGDVITHIYRTNGSTIFDDNNKVLPCVWEARERGVIFESGCARSHLSLDSVKKAFADNFQPQIISTDLIGDTFYYKPSFSLMYKMSIYLNMNMELDDIIKAVTVTPSNVYNLKEAGTTMPGKTADVAVFKVVEKKHTVNDLYGGSLDCERLVVPMATIKKGKIVFQQIFL